jgi:hypothetical protein
MEDIIMNLHNKMKNLESKYIDLANFYKKELVNKKSVSNYSPLRNFDDNGRHNRFSATTHHGSRSRSPFQNSPDLDHNAESSIINELLQEKNDLERGLENMINL